MSGAAQPSPLLPRIDWYSEKLTLNRIHSISPRWLQNLGQGVTCHDLARCWPNARS